MPLAPPVTSAVFPSSRTPAAYIPGTYPPARMAPSPVPIVGGTGALGFGIALRLAAEGVPVVIGSRAADRAAEAAERLRERVPDADVEAAENADAATRGPIVLLTVPFRAQSENLTNLRDVLSEDQILVDSTVPLAAAVGGRATRLLGVPQGSAAQQAQEMAPDGVRIVSALHTVSAATLADLDHALDEDVPVAGNSKEAKRDVAELIARIPGLRPVDCGRLETARLIEGITPLLISVNARHKTHAGIKLTGLPEELW
jgi:8-hydroxy-5-deazaflavin:NADPH oxidoreductase